LTIALFVVFSIVIVLDIVLGVLEFRQPWQTRQLLLKIADAAEAGKYVVTRDFVHPADQTVPARVVLPATGALDRRMPSRL
jgi:hypothetical protein